MIDLIIAALLLLLAISGMIIRKTYYCLPLLEVKRRAERRDPVAAKLYRAVAYESSLNGLTWLFIALCSSLGFVLLARVTPVWLGLVAVSSLLWAVYVWLPGRRVTPLGTWLTLLTTPAIAWLLNYVHPALSRAADMLERRSPAINHTGLFERSDLLALIERQAKQADSRITGEELEIVRRTLSFDDQAVGDILTPAKHIKTVLTSDTVGPILINELYQQGQELVLVRESAAGPVVGMLEYKHLGLKSTGQVRDLMNPNIYYLHEDDSLSEALHAFFVTGCPLFVVVNSAQEYIGVVSTQNVMRALLGPMSGDDFDQYADLSAVAARKIPVAASSKQSQDRETEDVIEMA